MELSLNSWLLKYNNNSNGNIIKKIPDEELLQLISFVDNSSSGMTDGVKGAMSHPS